MVKVDSALFQDYAILDTIVQLDNGLLHLQIIFALRDIIVHKDPQQNYNVLVEHTINYIIKVFVTIVLLDFIA